VSASPIQPQARAKLIQKALTTLFEADDVVGIWARFPDGHEPTKAGYFHGVRRKQLIREAIRLNNAGAAVCVSLNRLDPGLLARSPNCIRQAVPTITDRDVIGRRWVLLDFDTVRTGR
jgi:hypothetical protein